MFWTCNHSWDSIYALGRYDQRIDYTRPLTHAPPNDDAAWVQEQLKNLTASVSGWPERMRVRLAREAQAKTCPAKWDARAFRYHP